MRENTHLLYELDDWVREQFRAGVAELLEGYEARVGVAEHTVAVSSTEKMSHELPRAPPLLFTYPGTTWPLFSVFHRNSFICS